MARHAVRRCPYLIGRLPCSLRAGHTSGRVHQHGSAVRDRHGAQS